MMNPLIIQFKHTPILFTMLALLYCGIGPGARAVNPPPDGGYSGFNTAEGQDALMNLTTGKGNTAVGFSSLFTDMIGNFNTGVGAGTLFFNVGDQNTATGAGALLNNTTGSFNTANGVLALFDNTTGAANTATGFGALGNNTIGDENTANGANALLSNTTGNSNTAIGAAALSSNTTSGSNTAVGAGALTNNTSGVDNTATGRDALAGNTEGNGNTANGRTALAGNTTGTNNTAAGFQALLLNHTGTNNTAVGLHALEFNEAGSGNTALGSEAGNAVNGSGNVCLGQGVVGEAGVGDSTYIRNVNTLTQNFSAGVIDYVTVRLSDGRLGHTAVVSSRRYKEDIKSLDTKSQELYSLKPVSFRLKKEFDPAQQAGFGLIAEDVEQVDPDLVYRNNKGRVESVRYEMVNAMLLNEFLKEHRKNQEQQSKIDRQGAIIARQQRQIEALTAGLQKVSAQLELNKPTPQTVLNDQ